jgi:hypothetical protein
MEQEQTSAQKSHTTLIVVGALLGMPRSDHRIMLTHSSRTASGTMLVAFLAVAPALVSRRLSEQRRQQESTLTEQLLMTDMSEESQ